MFSLPHSLYTLRRSSQQGKDGTGVPGTVRLQLLQLIGLFQCQLARGGHRRIHLQRTHRRLPAGGGTDITVHPGTKSGNVLLGNGETGSQLMAAETIQQVRAGLQGGEEIKAAVRPAGPSSRTIFQMDHKTGAGVFLAEAGSHNTHHSLVPFLTCENQRTALLLRPGLNLFNGIGTDRLLHSLAFPVQFAQFPGQLFGTGRVRRLQQVRRQVRRPHTACGIDSGREDKSDLD